MPSDADNVFAQVTDNLIALYRNVERSTLGLPLLSFMPFLIFFWSLLKFDFYLVVGLYLIVPVNLVILVRNLVFPGRWRYRPFFLRQLYYIWLWIWRGEAPTAPFIFVRPLLLLFLKKHFESRLRRLRNEILLNGALSEDARSALVIRVDGALERWKSPRFARTFFFWVVPGVLGFPTLYGNMVSFANLFGHSMPSRIGTDVISTYMSTGSLVLFGSAALGYMLALPVTAFLGKRGLFIGRSSDRVCFPGGQAGAGIYSQEREIFGLIGVRMREVPLDLWALGISLLLTLSIQILALSPMIEWMAAYFDRIGLQYESEADLYWSFIGGMLAGGILLLGLIVLAAVRRRQTGRL